jgi:hypothetical protein
MPMKIPDLDNAAMSRLATVSSGSSGYTALILMLHDDENALDGYPPKLRFKLKSKLKQEN